ncbi:hypothetical protein ASA1KI_45320 [Opitutales bacterium ASA1]|uniref:hypothetical protein n=1 Tax=Congregicoccus parvus TaxID=3081749 RepID=UPI002B2F7184|nr:hypothetical protein ASA1KI_45320 [Opitutales bacterium ASA1]
MNNSSEKPKAGSFWLSCLAFIGCFLIFATILRIANMPAQEEVGLVPANLTPEERLERNLLTPDERRQRLIELKAKAKTASESYAWIDRNAGAVQLPVARAMELVVQESKTVP